MGEDLVKYRAPVFLPVLLFFFIFFLGVSVTCQSFQSPSSPPEPRHIHPDASLSSPSGAGHKDLLRDWVHAAAQQGGVKPAGMFHIHTEREYIISPSGHFVLSAGRASEFSWINLHDLDFFFFFAT